MKFRVTILLLLGFVNVGCSTLVPVEVPDKTKLLVLVDTDDQFNIVHDGDHIFPAARPIHSINGQPSWKLSSLFIDHVAKYKDVSRFNLIIPDQPVVPREYAGNGGYWVMANYLKNRAREESADYILLLTMHPVWNIHLTITLDSEYGYYFSALRPWFGLVGDGKTYLNGNILLINSREITDGSLNSKAHCNDYHRGTLKSRKAKAYDIPLEIEGEFSLDLIDNAEAEKIYAAAVKDFEKRFDEALAECTIIPALPEDKSSDAAG